MSDVSLTDAQRVSIEEVSRWEQEAFVALAHTQLAYRDALREVERLRAELEAKENAARRAQVQTRRVLDVVGAELQLPPGFWTYDAVAGKLVRKG